MASAVARPCGFAAVDLIHLAARNQPQAPGHFQTGPQVGETATGVQCRVHLFYRQPTRTAST